MDVYNFSVISKYGNVQVTITLYPRTDREVGGMDTAHEGMVLSLDWHPLGHILASGSNDHTAKFWTRNRPGDLMQDKYNLNTNPNEGLYDQGELQEMALEDPHGLQVGMFRELGTFLCSYVDV